MSEPDFIALQRGFTAHIRDPGHRPVPGGVKPERMAVYRELVYSNMDEQLSTQFPVLREITTDERWHALVSDFLRRHRCQTPLFTEIGQEFLSYLRDVRGLRASDPPFLLELAHYEWVELALHIDDTDPGTPDILADSGGNLMTGHPVVSALAWPLVYAYDVHRISSDYQPDQAPDQATYLIAFRNPRDEVRFMEVNAVTFRLLELLESDMAISGQAAATQIADELNHPDPDVVVAGAGEILTGLRDRGIVLGSRPV